MGGYDRIIPTVSFRAEHVGIALAPLPAGRLPLRALVAEIIRGATEGIHYQFLKY